MAAAAGEKDPYKDTKSLLLSQTRAAAKKIGQNAAMFAQLQVRTCPPIAPFSPLLSAFHSLP